jgi:hypothetical protein
MNETEEKNCGLVVCPITVNDPFALGKSVVTKKGFNSGE